MKQIILMSVIEPTFTGVCYLQVHKKQNLQYVEINLRSLMIAMICMMRNLQRSLLKTSQTLVVYITKPVMSGKLRFQDMKRKPNPAQPMIRQMKLLNLKDLSHLAKEETRRKQKKLSNKTTSLKKRAVRKRRKRNPKNLPKLKRNHLAKDKRSLNQRSKNNK